MRGREDHVRAHRGNGAFLQRQEKPLAQFLALPCCEIIDGRAVSGTEHDIPEVTGAPEPVLARHRLSESAGDAAAREQVGERLRGGDLIPWAERPVERRLDLADGGPEQAAGRLEQARTPGGDGQRSARGVPVATSRPRTLPCPRRRTRRILR
jgi:hypothetical protein